MDSSRSLADIRREYGRLCLESVLEDPMLQFKQWMEEVLQSQINDPTAMVLSTVDAKGHPDSRVVLLKGIKEGKFIFYTNYESTKGRQLKHHAYAALNFYWPELTRQVRIRGRVKKTSQANSDQYFYTRPKASQLSAIISPQSQVIAEYADLEKALDERILQQAALPIKRPSHWGGYALSPDEIEFWQGRDNRLHDRIQYYREGTKWSYQRLAP